MNDVFYTLIYFMIGTIFMAVSIFFLGISGEDYEEWILGFWLVFLMWPFVVLCSLLILLGFIFYKTLYQLGRLIRHYYYYFKEKRENKNRIPSINRGEW